MALHQTLICMDIFSAIVPAPVYFCCLGLLLAVPCGMVMKNLLGVKRLGKYFTFILIIYITDLHPLSVFYNTLSARQLLLHLPHQIHTVPSTLTSFTHILSFILYPFILALSPTVLFLMTQTFILFLIMFFFSVLLFTLKATA